MINSFAVFEAHNFSFADEVPPHVEATPHKEHENGGYAVSVVKPYSSEHRVLAIDVPTLEICKGLVVARITKQIPSVKAYGYSDDIYMWLPDNDGKLVYEGWTWGNTYGAD